MNDNDTIQSAIDEIAYYAKEHPIDDILLNPHQAFWSDRVRAAAMLIAFEAGKLVYKATHDIDTFRDAYQVALELIYAEVTE